MEKKKTPNQGTTRPNSGQILTLSFIVLGVGIVWSTCADDRAIEPEYESTPVSLTVCKPASSHFAFELRNSTPKVGKGRRKKEKKIVEEGIQKSRRRDIFFSSFRLDISWALRPILRHSPSNFATGRGCCHALNRRTTKRHGGRTIVRWRNLMYSSATGTIYIYCDNRILSALFIQKIKSYFAHLRFYILLGFFCLIRVFFVSENPIFQDVGQNFHIIFFFTHFFFSFFFYKLFFKYSFTLQKLCFTILGDSK